MNNGPILSSIRKAKAENRRAHWVLLDPDDFTTERAVEVARVSQESGVGALLVGGSLMQTNRIDTFVKSLREAVSIPVILFPGDATQLSKHASALLYLSLISGRNPVNLIGEQVKAAPIIRQYGLEPISTGYMLVESGAVTSVEFMSGTRPLPRAKPDIAAAHALAAMYLGMDMIYLEAGSGAALTVPAEMISAVRGCVDIPVIVGGGIRDEETALEKLRAGADIIVTGNLLQKENGLERMRGIAGCVRDFRS
ncbi:MAG: geranylgeranylglyceryl/heptaprenylglyceryl phosphate synthase [Chitinispirillales bacterium]|jgi:phosphoglycerol geranylgeranyltransferase|nr:geranylgeranylglyceryl/heptaprenylglyceryl phosphate synthase [Chitinispirillales bacterium]